MVVAARGRGVVGISRTDGGEPHGIMRRPPLIVLQRHHRRSVWERALLVGCATFAIDLVVGYLGGPIRLRIAVVVAGVLAAVLLRWLRPYSIRRTACVLDSSLSANS